MFQLGVEFVFVDRVWIMSILYCIHQPEYDVNNKRIKNNKFKYDPISNWVNDTTCITSLII